PLRLSDPQPRSSLLSSTILVGWSRAWPAPLGWLWRSVGLASPSAARPSGAPVSCLLNFITYGNPWLDPGTFTPPPPATPPRPLARDGGDAGDLRRRAEPRDDRQADHRGA